MDWNRELCACVGIFTLVGGLDGAFIFDITDDHLDAFFLEDAPLGLCGAGGGEDGDAAELGPLGENCVQDEAANVARGAEEEDVLERHNVVYAAELE